MFRRIALASAVILGSFSFATVARADDHDVRIPFTADVNFECEFSNVQAGILGYDEFPATVLSSKLGEGQSGMANLLCNGDADLLAEAGQEAGPPLDSPIDYLIEIDPDEVEAGEDTKITVDLTVDNGEIIEPGDYIFVVTLTAVQQ